ncbi:hypothetical protein ABW19_dt0209870 [Dactylella cylindrospora]|nr:hypothetical protein ABW19_dt0209870 [Dactylella cylindrospora]
MPPKKKDTAAASPPVRRSARNSTNKSTTEEKVATTPTKSKSTPTKSAEEVTDMGSAASAIKKAKGKRSAKAAKVSNDADVSSKIGDLSVDDSTATASVKSKRKNATPQDSQDGKAATTKKARLSKSGEPEEEASQPPPPKPAPKTAPAKPKTVEDWYSTYASSDDPEQIDIPGIIRLLEDLDIKFDGASIYILCWKLGCGAMGSIPKKNWVDGMNKHGIKNNTQLLKTLADWLKDTKPTSPPSDTFLQFYKFMFNFSKPTPETRSVALDSATAVLSFLLDPVAYDLRYDPETATPLASDVHPYPHTAPFLRFLVEKQPVKVINKDQWDSFVPFNKSVNYNLDNYNPEGAWPALYDQYVDWRKETEGLEIGSKDAPDTES